MFINIKIKADISVISKNIDVLEQQYYIINGTYKKRYEIVCQELKNQNLTVLTDIKDVIYKFILPGNNDIIASIIKTLGFTSHKETINAVDILTKLEEYIKTEKTIIANLQQDDSIELCDKIIKIIKVTTNDSAQSIKLMIKEDTIISQTIKNHLYEIIDKDEKISKSTQDKIIDIIKKDYKRQKYQSVITNLNDLYPKLIRLTYIIFEIKTKYCDRKNTSALDEQAKIITQLNRSIELTQGYYTFIQEIIKSIEQEMLSLNTDIIKMIIETAQEIEKNNNEFIQLKQKFDTINTKYNTLHATYQQKAQELENYKKDDLGTQIQDLTTKLAEKDKNTKISVIPHIIIILFATGFGTTIHKINPNISINKIILGTKDCKSNNDNIENVENEQEQFTTNDSGSSTTMHEE